MDSTTEANSTKGSQASAKHDAKYAEARKKRMVKKLINLYKENDCLWNVRSPKFFDASLKKEAWESIAKEMNTTWNNVKCCIYCLRCRLNFEMRHKRQHCREASNFFLAEQFKFLRLPTDKKKFVAAQQTSRRSPPIAKPKSEINCQADEDASNDKEFYAHLFELHEERCANNLAKMRKWSDLQKKQEPPTPEAPRQTPACPKTPSYRKLENYFIETRSPLSKTVAELRKKANAENK